MNLSVTVNLMSDGAAVLSIRGQIDHANTQELREAVQSVLTDRRPGLLRVDLGLVTFIDSGGVGALVAAHRMAATEGCRLVVINASPFVSRQLTNLGVVDLLGMAPVPDSLLP